MKQADMAMLILIVSISLLVSYFVGNSVFGGESTRSTEVEVVQSISVEFDQPDKSIFNKSAVNLTETINIGPNNTTSPFSSD